MGFIALFSVNAMHDYKKCFFLRKNAENYTFTMNGFVFNNIFINIIVTFCN